jgi:hypothetical protein
MATSKQIIITSGSYAKSNTGNFTARDSKGNQFFISASTMQAAGIAKDVMPVFPMFGFANTRMIGQFIAGTTDPLLDGEGNPVLVSRDEIASIFLDEVSFEKIANAEFSLATRLQAGRETIVKASGLSEESISMLLSASI